MRMDDGAARKAAPSAGSGETLAARLRVVHQRMLEAVLGGGGLGEVAELAAEAAGAPVAVLVPRLDAAVASPGARADLAALRRYVTERCRGRPVPVPSGVAGEAAIQSGGEIVGGVLLLGDPTSPDGGEFLQIAALAALTEVAVQGGRAEVERTVRDQFFEELRSRRPPSGEEILRRGARLGADLRRGAVALCAELTTERPRHMAARVSGEHEGVLAHCLETAGGRLYALVPAAEDPEKTVTAAQAVADDLRRHGTVGVSSFYGEPGELGRALGEAELVLDVLRRGEVPVGEDLGSGAYRLLFRVFASHPDEVRSFYEDTVAPLVRYDESYGSDLVATLETFLEHNGATGAAAAALYVHRHTIAYRLERVKELSGLDPALSEDRERLGLGLKAYRILSPRLPR
jgi:PucR family transcriptional regulator, purine catabolism regulatory protein